MNQKEQKDVNGVFYVVRDTDYFTAEDIDKVCDWWQAIVANGDGGGNIGDIQKEMEQEGNTVAAVLLCECVIVHATFIPSYYGLDNQVRSGMQILGNIINKGKFDGDLHCFTNIIRPKDENDSNTCQNITLAAFQAQEANKGIDVAGQTVWKHCFNYINGKDCGGLEEFMVDGFLHQLENKKNPHITDPIKNSLQPVFEYFKNRDVNKNVIPQLNTWLTNAQSSAYTSPQFKKLADFNALRGKFSDLKKKVAVLQDSSVKEEVIPKQEDGLNIESYLKSKMTAFPYFNLSLCDTELVSSAIDPSKLKNGNTYTAPWYYKVDLTDGSIKDSGFEINVHRDRGCFGSIFGETKISFIKAS
jgi:hypothetical protein